MMIPRAVLVAVLAAGGSAAAAPKKPAPAPIAAPGPAPTATPAPIPASAPSPCPHFGPSDSTARASENSGLAIAPSGHPFTHLVVDNPLGSVAVEGYDGNAIQIQTLKYGPTDDSLDRLRVSLVPSADGTVRITTTAEGGREVQPVARGAVRIDLIIRAPRDAHVEASSSGGKLDIANLDAGGDLDTASGAISVCNVGGEVWTHSVTGATKLVQVFGSVDAQSISADVDLDSISGERLVATVDRGSIAGRRVRSRDIQLTTTDGKIQLEAEASLHGKISLASLGGDVDVHLHRHGSVVIRARGAKVDFGSGLGSSSRALSDGWRQIALGDADPAAAMVELRSQRGNVQFVIVE